MQLNSIGADPTGTIAFPNAGHGILILNGSDNQVAISLISGNGQSGIAIVGEDADNNIIVENTLGTQHSVDVALPNGAHGIFISDGDSNKITKNLSSGNLLSGISIEGTAVLNELAGNQIGTSRNGTAALPNQGDGVVIKSPRNRVGGNSPTLRNLISGNGKTGITLSGSGASSNVIEGNFVGTDFAGTLAIPNRGDGIRVFNAPRNRIGSATEAAAGNLISGNGGSGISFTNPGSTGNLVLGNFVGVAADGLAALGNTGNGVLLSSGATNVQIGGTNATSRNIIAANGSSGISISSTAQGNRVSRNLIGINTAGAARGNGNAGVSIQGSGNTIGGTNATFANTIAGNPVGIILSGPTATNNAIAFNTIGTEATALSGNGIQVANGASTNTIGPKNTIRRTLTGIRIADGSREIRITQNSIALNFNLGIDLLPGVGVTNNDAGDADTGANRLQNYPTFSGNALIVGNDVEFTFSVNTSPVHAAYPLTIEVYSSDGDGEGITFLGTTLYTEANFASGAKTVTLTGAAIGLTAGVSRIVALATDLLGNTSEFSRQANVTSGAARMASGTEQVGAVSQTNSLFDFNGDKRLDTKDVSLILRALRNPTSLTSTYDVDGDGALGIRDVLLVIRGLELKKMNWRRVAAISATIHTQTWDESLLDLLNNGGQVSSEPV